MPRHRAREELRSRGWEPRVGLVVHTRALKAFSTDTLWNRHAYLQVLLNWESLADRLGQVRSDLPQSYFKCIARGFMVAQGRKAAYYIKVLAAGGNLDDADLAALGTDAVQEGRAQVQAPEGMAVDPEVVHGDEVQEEQG